ncbi:hypothetical protein [Deinococcus marmoris]|uniref:Uncharacterized protein n=1 Tax=Deinococcus marmoris TaxID=249408 RepID=A0A1U7P4U8_9DEIO|nr:hypothetical protein [Deinococcus marmoris]OLV20197.1 hypothetical protein BOO71_0000619 [Deinococcus marmoris]
MDHRPPYRDVLSACDDAEQARSIALITLYTDLDLERVLRGPRKGQDFGDALDAELRGMAECYGQVSVRCSVVHPWWNLFRPVQRLMLIPPDVTL